MMYSEYNRRASGMRANDEFLRRMIGGELTGGEMPVMNMGTQNFPSFPELGNNDRPSCNGGVGDCELLRNSNENGTVSRGKPNCQGEYEEDGNGNGEACPTHVHAPSLAMVYSPRQCWRNLLDPESALEDGSLFAELVMPWEPSCNMRETEGRGRRC